MTDGALTHAILELLDAHSSLGYAEVAERLGEQADAVRDALTRLRGVGLVEALGAGELEAHLTRAATAWQLTDAGREQLARLRAERRDA